MSDAAVDQIRQIYGHNWASLGSRREGIALGLEIVGAGFEYQLDPTAFGERTLTGVQGVENFLQGIEEDFRDLRQRADHFVDAGETEDGHRIVVLGETVGRGRLSGLPFQSPFGHIWTVNDGKVVRIESYLDHDLALAAVGLPPIVRQK
jgi:ketosteroid isomerase-like protein